MARKARMRPSWKKIKRKDRPSGARKKRVTQRS